MAARGFPCSTPNPAPCPLRWQWSNATRTGRKPSSRCTRIRFLVVVAPDENGTPGRPQAFITTGAQAINLHRNIWHGVLTPLAAPGLFAVIDRIGPPPEPRGALVHHPVGGAHRLTTALPDRHTRLGGRIGHVFGGGQTMADNTLGTPETATRCGLHAPHTQGDPAGRAACAGNVRVERHPPRSSWRGLRASALGRTRPSFQT